LTTTDLQRLPCCPALLPLPCRRRLLCRVKGARPAEFPAPVLPSRRRLSRRAEGAYPTAWRHATSRHATWHHLKDARPQHVVAATAAAPPGATGPAAACGRAVHHGRRREAGWAVRAGVRGSPRARVVPPLSVSARACPGTAGETTASVRPGPWRARSPPSSCPQPCRHWGRSASRRRNWR